MGWSQKYLALLQEMSNMFFPSIWTSQMSNRILHIQAHPSFFYTPLYHNLLDITTQCITPLLSISLHPFHAFHLTLQ
jgi:hypothetical protein